MYINFRLSIILYECNVILRTEHILYYVQVSNKRNTKTNQNKKTPTTKSISNIGRYKKVTHNKKFTLMCISNTMNIKKRI